MLILGTIFRCLGPIVTVVALLSSKPLFLNPLERRDEARAYVVSQSVNTFISYCVLLVPGKGSLQRTVIFLPMSRHSMNIWKWSLKGKHKAISGDSAKTYENWHKSFVCSKLIIDQNFISASTLREAMILRQDFVVTLSEIGFIPIDAIPSTPAKHVQSKL
jgi:hypothetical protein